MILTNAEIYKYGKNNNGRQYVCLFIENGLETIEQMTNKHVSISIREPLRSKQSNQYLFYLIKEISNITGSTPKQIYQHFVLEFQNIDTEIVPIEEVDKKCREFCNDHVGRMCKISNTKSEKEKEIVFYYGTSDYSTKEFRTFINMVEDELQNLRTNP